MSEYNALNFSPANILTVSTSTMVKEEVNQFEVIKKTDFDLLMDKKMRERAIQNYGVQEFLKNIDSLKNENKTELDVQYLWEWLDCK